MFAQCVVITIILFAISAGFFLSKRKKWALLSLPLVFLPFANVALGFVYKYFIKEDFNDFAVISVLAVASIISCTTLGMLTAQYISGKKTRSLYTSVGAVFNVLLTVILLKYYLLT